MTTSGTTPTTDSAMATNDPVAITSGISHVALTVTDLSVSVPWYEKVLGLAPALDEDTGPFRHVVFVIGSTLLGLHTFPDGALEDVSFDPRRPGLDHVSFACADRAGLAAWAARLDELGVSHSEIEDAGYGSGVSFKDPDGLPLEVFCPPAP